MLRSSTASLELANLGNLWQSEHIDMAAADSSTWFSVFAASFNFILSVATLFLIPMHPHEENMMGPPPQEPIDDSSNSTDTTDTTSSTAPTTGSAL